MTEFAVGASVMSLMLLGSITIAGYQEVQRRIAIAARQAAFEVAWNNGRSEPTAILQRAAESRLDDAAVVDAFGHRQIGASEISSAAAIQSAPGRARTAALALVEPLRVVGGFLGGGFDLSAQGLLTGTTTVRIPANPRLPEPFSALALELQQPVALMTDAWNASGPSHVRNRTTGLVPTSTLSRLQTLWRPLLAPLTLIEPSLARLCLGIIEADRVPEDRLGTGRTPLPGRCP
jgi:Flp pilus assembly protein TadG